MQLESRIAGAGLVGVGKTARKRMNWVPELFQRGVNIRRGDLLLREKNRFDMKAIAARLIGKLPNQKLEIIEILHARLEQDEREIRLNHALERNGHWRFRTHMKQNVIEVPAAVAKKRRDRGNAAHIRAHG